MVAIDMCGKRPIMGGHIFSRATGSMSAVLVEVGFFVGVSQVFFLFYYLLCKRRVLGNCP